MQRDDRLAEWKRAHVRHGTLALLDRFFLRSRHRFGDFDLLFGAARLNLKIADVPVHYKARTYGETNISRFRHGLILLKMCAFAARKIKFI